MLRLSSGQVAIRYISSPIQYQDLGQIEFIAHFTQMLRASEAALDSKHSLRPARLNTEPSKILGGCIQARPADMGWDGLGDGNQLH